MKAKVLLVDNHPNIHDSLVQNLRLEGYDVTVAANEQEALHALRDTAFDLVQLDVVMAAVNSWDAFQHIITIRFSLPIIIITGRTDQQWLAAQKGVVAVLEKPLDMPLLLDVMKRALAE